MKRTPPTGPLERIPYYRVRKGSKIECYQLHRPTECRHISPATKENIHLCETKEREYVLVNQKTHWRKLYIPKPRINQLFIDNTQFEKLKSATKIETQEEKLKAMKEREILAVKKHNESEERKKRLKENLQNQPGETITEDKELNGPDQKAHTLSRAELLLAENLQGPQKCNRIILASKCHAIRDAQLKEKELIKKAMLKEDRRLDKIMEENRLAAIERAEAEEKRRYNLRLQNLAALKEQIKAREVAKIMETERIEEESIRLNQANIALQIEEANKMKEKHRRQLEVKKMLDQGSEEILYYKQMALEEERIMDMRIKNFQKAQMEREAKNKAHADAVQAARMRGTEHIAEAQKAELKLKEELDRLRMKKLQDDAEREFRRKEKEKAIKKNQQMKELHEARKEQIKGIHRSIAREIAKDEQAFNDACRQNEEYLKKQKESEDKHKAEVERHRQELMKQINENEVHRSELRERIRKEGVALRMEQEQKDKYERKIIKMKINNYRGEKISEKYVKEVEQMMAKLGYK